MWCNGTADSICDYGVHVSPLLAVQHPFAFTLHVCLLLGQHLYSELSQHFSFLNRLTDSIGGGVAALEGSGAGTATSHRLKSRAMKANTLISESFMTFSCK